MSTTLTTIIELSTAFSAVAALVLVGLQLRQQNKQQRYEALSQVHKEVATAEFREALRAIFSHGPAELATTTSVQLKEQIDDATAVYDLVGLRIQEGVLPKKAALKTEWKILIPLWIQLEDYVKKEREKRGMPYKEYFEWLALEAELYQEKNYPGSNPRVVKRPEETVN